MKPPMLNFPMYTYLVVWIEVPIVMSISFHIHFLHVPLCSLLYCVSLLPFFIWNHSKHMESSLLLLEKCHNMAFLPTKGTYLKIPIVYNSMGFLLVVTNKGCLSWCIYLIIFLLVLDDSLATYSKYYDKLNLLTFLIVSLLQFSKRRM